MQLPRDPITHLDADDVDTRGLAPASLFAPFKNDPKAGLLLSGGEHDAARYTFFGLSPFLTVRSRGDRFEVDLFDRTGTERCAPFAGLREVLAAYRTALPSPAAPFSAGGIGYFGYELGRSIERLPGRAVDDLGIPELYFVFYRSIVSFENATGRCRLATVTLRDDPAGETHGRTLERLRREIDGLGDEAPCEARRAPLVAAAGDKPVQGPVAPPDLASNFEKTDYLEAVRRIVRYIVDGDIYQANLSQRFSTGFGGDPYDLFHRLFRINPAPFFAYLDGGDFSVLSSSPERFLALREGRVETRPIKGTAPRGSSPDEDRRIATALCESVKDSAELSMIVDLLRNDLGRVCRFGTVEVTEHKRLEAYTNVFHLISVITGELRPDRDAVDLLLATFPGGSITGCPKIRSMEIIDELEPYARGVYTGAIGYLGFDGAMDLNIAIRTIVVKDGRLTFHVGGGIVYDSDPEHEYAETLHKAASMIEAIRGKD